MLEGTQIHAQWNLYQYALVFLLAMVVSSVVQFFSVRKFMALKAQSDAVGFAPTLALYYRSLGKLGPFPYTKGEDTMYNSLNSWLIGSLVAGTGCLLIVLIADIILYAVESRLA